jgi:hypothetical protein
MVTDEPAGTPLPLAPLECSPVISRYGSPLMIVPPMLQSRCSTRADVVNDSEGLGWAAVVKATILNPPFGQGVVMGLAMGLPGSGAKVAGPCACATA